MHVECQNDDDHDDVGQVEQSGGKRLLFRGRPFPERFPVQARLDTTSYIAKRPPSRLPPVVAAAVSARPERRTVELESSCAPLGL